MQHLWSGQMSQGDVRHPFFIGGGVAGTPWCICVGWMRLHSHCVISRLYDIYFVITFIPLAYDVYFLTPSACYASRLPTGTAIFKWFFTLCIEKVTTL